MPVGMDLFNSKRKEYLLKNEFPLGGRCIGKLNFTSAGKNFLEHFLPEKLELAPQEFTNGDEHPVLLMFNDMYLHANGFLERVAEEFGISLNLHYNEFVLVIPYVRFRHDEYKDEGPFCYLPVLYLDSILAILGGRVFWDFNKLPARFMVNPVSFQVSTPFLEHTLFTSGFTVTGAQVPAKSIENFAAIIPILELPVIENSLDEYMVCRYVIDYANANITPIDSVTQNKSCGYLPGYPLQVPSIEEKKLGGFVMEYNWSLSYLKQIV